VAEKEFLSFEEALRELRLKEEELKRLVSEGEIRAFRDGETVKLRKKDVEDLRSELSGGEVVDLGSPTAEELVFEDDTDLDAGMATEEIPEADTILEESVEEVGEVALDDEPAEEDDEPVLVGSRAEVDEPYEGALVRTAMVLTFLVLMLGFPLCLALSRGVATNLAKGIAGWFTTI
jgi:excisionase family DNA binding protein